MKDNKKLRKISEEELSEFGNETEKQNLKEIWQREKDENPKQNISVWKRYCFVAVSILIVIGLSVYFANVILSARNNNQNHGESGIAEATDSFSQNSDNDERSEGYEIVSLTVLNDELSYFILSLNENTEAERYYRGEETLYYSVNNQSGTESCKINVNLSSETDCSFSVEGYSQKGELAGFTVDYIATTVENDGVKIINIVGEILTDKEKIYFSYERNMPVSEYSVEGIISLVPIKKIIIAKN